MNLYVDCLILLIVMQTVFTLLTPNYKDEWNKHQFLPPTQEDVPSIALVVSGGGQRAAVGLLGSIHQMEQDALMDTVLYMGGVSGSTW